MRILLTGRNGQLGSKLEEDLKNLYEVIATDRNTLNLIDAKLIKDTVHQIEPDLIINTAAYTNVDKAEKERYLAYQINALAPKALSQMANELDIPIIHISTDYVFDGLKKDPYLETDKPNPLSVYGKTKYKGEEFVRRHPKHFILRTSWIFSSKGDNFLKTIIKLAQEKTVLSIVGDQWGSPTSVETISNSIQAIIQHLKQYSDLNAYGTYHVTSNGETNWYLYAAKILDILEAFKFKPKPKLKRKHLNAISSVQYPQNVIRPKNSKLNTAKFKKTFSIDFPFWEDEIYVNLKMINDI